jgi:hypothetical protein
MVQLDVEPEGLVEHRRQARHRQARRAAGDFELFTRFIEGRGAETGAWRGEVPRDTAT